MNPKKVLTRKTNFQAETLSMLDNMIRAFIAKLIIGGVAAVLAIGGLGYFIAAALNDAGIWRS